MPRRMPSSDDRHDGNLRVGHGAEREPQLADRRARAGARGRCLGRHGGAGWTVAAIEAVTSGHPDRRAAETASRPAGVRDARCARPACRPSACRFRRGSRASLRPGPRRRAAATARPALRTSAAMPASISASSVGVGREHLAGVHPQVVDRTLHPRVRLVGAVAQPDHPVARALDVIRGLLRGLGGDGGDARVASIPASARRSSRCHASNRNCRAIVSAKLPFGCSTSSRLRNSTRIAEEGELVLVRARPRKARLDFARVG